jgi:hypothetical protein
MYNFLEIGEGKTGFVNLKEILKADSLPALLNSLSEQVSSSVMKGRFKAELSNLEKTIDAWRTLAALFHACTVAGFAQWHLSGPDLEALLHQLDLLNLRRNDDDDESRWNGYKL